MDTRDIFSYEPTDPLNVRDFNDSNVKHNENTLEDEINEIAVDLLTEENSNYIEGLRNQSKVKLKEIQVSLLSEGITEENYNNALNKVKEIVRENNLQISTYSNPLAFDDKNFKKLQITADDVVTVIYNNEEFSLAEFQLYSKKTSIDNNKVEYRIVTPKIELKQIFQTILPSEINVDDLEKYPTIKFITKNRTYDLKELLKNAQLAYKAIKDDGPYQIIINTGNISYTYEKGKLVHLE